MTDVKGPAPSLLDKVKEPSREESETRRKDFEQHVAAQPGFATAAGVLARDTLPAGRADAAPILLEVPDTAPTRVGTEPGLGPAPNALPKVIVPEASDPALDDRRRATAPPTPKGVRSTARYDAPALALPSKTSPFTRTTIVVAILFLLASALAYFATRPDHVVPAAGSASGTATTGALMTTTAPVTAAATATIETSAPVSSVSVTATTGPSPDRSASSKRTASARASAEPTQAVITTTSATTAKTAPSTTASSPPTSTVPWIKPQNP